MCGIVAQFVFEDKQPDKSRIRKMLADIQHRGPNDDGFFSQDWFGIGHCRLLILDLSKNGHQPMFDEMKNFAIVYNGELYNYKDIKSELQSEGYRFFLIPTLKLF
jgi:asparagine synthase (glutamine-hydrolysing)|tara:strand:- start:2800 stop:3114 length:315 start_codon:yes stop_codon:yes gene_type:complete